MKVSHHPPHIFVNNKDTTFDMEADKKCIQDYDKKR